MQACTVPLAVSISGVAPYEQAAVRCAAPGWTLYVTVTVAQTEAVVVAAHPVVAGQALAASDLAVRREAVQLFAGRQVYVDPAQLVGASAVMSLAAGMVITQDAVQAPLVVKAGQMIAVQVISGGVILSVNAVANQPGRIGDTILLTNPSSGRRFSAQVTANGPVVQLQ
jgi:flagella basal body P-ring formation protein FlgA